MAFQDSNPFGVLADTQSPSPAAAAGSPPQVQLVGAEGEEPLEVVIENVGFLALGGDTKVKILPKGYDKDSLPPSSVSLFSVANRSGLFAAAAHSDLVVGSTSSLRETFAGASDGVAEYRPQLSLSLPANISHIAFTADESHLVVGSASGGLVVYSVSALNSSNAQPLFELGTGGVGLREMKPNPATPELVAVVTTNGDVQMVNISTGGWEEGSNGPVLKTGASTVSWSQRGKQIVCGMGDGTGWQMTPQGEGKAVLPSVPGLENHFVSSIVWLENNLFITTHTPVPAEPQNNDSLFHVLVRTGSSFTYTRLPDPVPPYGLDSRTPPYFFHALIKQYAPALKDMIIFSNTCSSDIGLISRFSTAVAGEPPAPADAWITSSIGDDTRRAQLPLSGTDFQDTSVMGMALDLSNKESVKRPVGGEEIEESPGPLPILMVLNHEGLLCAWHVIYNDAMEQREKYTGMMVYSPQDQQQQQQQPPRPGTPPRTSFAAAAPTAGTSSSFGAFASKSGPSAFGTARSAFGAPSFGTPSMSSPFAGAASAQTSGSAFGQPSALGASSPFAKAAAMGSTTSGSAFGQTSALGQTSGTAFGQPSVLGGASPFAKAAASGTTSGSAFGQPSALGGSPSPFANAASVGPATPTPAFGAPTSLGLGKNSTPGFGQTAPLGSTGALGSLSSGFGAYADKAGFAAAAPSANATPIWGNSSKGFNTDPTPSAFTASNTSGFGSLAGSGFKISSGFKPDSSTADETTTPSNAGSSFGLGGGFRDALGTAQATPRGFSDQGPKDADMDSDAEQDNNASDDDEDAPPPTRLQGGPSQPTSSTSFSRSGGLPSGIFAKASAEASKSSPFASVNKPAGSESPFAQSPFGKPTTTDPQSSPFGAAASGSPFAHGKAAFAPLPPSSTPPAFSSWGSVKQTTSPFTTGAQPMKPAFGSTGFGAFAPKPQPSSTERSTPPVTGQPEAAPLPPDFTSSKVKSETAENVVPDAPLPPDFTSSKKETKQELNAEDAPLPPDFTSVKKEAKQHSNAEDAPLPPDFTSQKKADKGDRLESAAEDAPLPPDFTNSLKEKAAEEEIPSLPADESEDEGIDAHEEEIFDDDKEDDEQDDEDDGEGEEDEDEEEGEGEEDEEEDEEDEDEDEDGEEDVWLKEQQERPVTPKEFKYDPKPKPSTTSPSTSNIFGSNTSFKDTIGTVDKAAPFAGLFGSKPTPSKEIEHGKTPTKTSSLFGAPKGKSPGHGITPPSGKDKLSRSGSGMGGSGMFNKAKKVGAAEIGKSVTTPAPASSSPPFPTPSPIPAPAPTAFSAATNKAGFAAPSGSPPVSSFPQPSLAPKSLGSTPPAAGRQQPSPFTRTASAPSPFSGTNFGSPTAQQQTRSSPLSAPSFQQAPKEVEKVEEPDSDLDLDKEFNELDDEKVRRKLQRGTIKPLENLPKIKNMGEIQLSDDFNEVFDAIYLNGNMMVNRLGLTVRGMTAYHMAQTQPIADCKHESAKDMKQSKDWKFCELEKVRKILEEVLDGVKKENKGNEELEAQYEAANKGFIKLDTKDAEIKRLLAVHNDPRAAALARARTLTSEQHLQQIKLRKEYTRVEKLLKDAEKEVTQLKAKIASRDKNNAGTVVPPTVEAVRNTIMKLTGMVERKNGDIEYLADRLNRVKLKSRSISVTPSGRSRLMSPDIGIRSEAPSMRFSTPERGLGSSIGPSFGSVPTPVLTLTDPTDVAVAREEKKARREMGNRLRGVLEKNGPRVTGGQGQGNYFMK
ncbi:uncharacterized protein H6S33_010653 [Morchella sextelata]|uniref:uncharacterized protein n=1 Tax=Morchella sextelata TaxID=1174677 RepID=UPI001D047477|nr:uncharacterized protein H6S33_010653 [Morchella sextelata]KAH0611388.1 hypothetical protein H6S33_010653 [Morchella sextelata]